VLSILKLISTIIRLKYLVVLLFFVSCKTHKKSFIVKEILLNFSGGNSYPEFSNRGNFLVTIQESDSNISSIKSKRTFDAFSPLKKPIQVLITKKNSLALLTSNKKEFFLGNLNNEDSLCIYGCNLIVSPRSTITFNSYINPVPYWHGLSPLGGLSLFMNYRHYRLTIRNENGSKLSLHWKYSVHKLKQRRKKRKQWSDDYCEDSGGGLVEIKIK